jgi:uncharacterized protein (TIGR03435 family)
VIRFLAFLLASAAAFAQSSVPGAGAAPAPAFEVVSIKPSTADPRFRFIRTPPSGLVTGTNVTVAMLIRFAYGLPDHRIVGAPAWAFASAFDVTARGPAEAPIETTKAMFRALLADRFGAIVRPETREMEMDVLLRSGRESGPELRAASRPCGVAAVASGADGCGIRIGFGRIAGRDVSMADLASGLESATQRHVVDDTGLTGRYDLSVTYTPDAVVLNPSVRAEFPAIDPDGPSLGTALREQLGLRLQPRRGPVEVLVVERVQPPSPD